MCIRDRDQSQHPNVDRVPGRVDRFEVAATVAPGTEDKSLARDGLLDGRRTRRQLGPDGNADEVGAIRVETLADEQVDLTEVDHSEVERDLLGFLKLGCHLPSLYHLVTISVTSIQMVTSDKARASRAAAAPAGRFLVIGFRAADTYEPGP